MLYEKKNVILDVTKEIINVKEMIKYVMGRSIRIVKYFVALVKLEDGIWSNVDKHVRFVVCIHDKSELMCNIEECQNAGNGIWVVENYLWQKYTLQ